MEDGGEQSQLKLPSKVHVLPTHRISPKTDTLKALIMAQVENPMETAEPAPGAITEVSLPTVKAPAVINTTSAAMSVCDVRETVPCPLTWLARGQFINTQTHRHKHTNTHAQPYARTQKYMSVSIVAKKNPATSASTLPYFSPLPGDTNLRVHAVRVAPL